MILTGLITEINLSSSDLVNNKYRVQINYFKTPGDEDTSNFTFTANACVPSGTMASYKVGDKVYVDFIYDKFSLPVIIGKIYQGTGVDDSEGAGYNHLDALNVDSAAQLPSGTQIGEISYEQLKEIIGKNYNFTNGEVLVGDNSQIVSSGYTVLKNSDQWVEDDKHLATTLAIKNNISGGGGTSDFDQLTNRPKYNGSAMTHETNIPEVKTATWDGKSVVSGTNDGTNWTKITINGTEMNIPQGGGSGTTKYFHSIVLTNAHNNGPECISFTIVNTTSSAYTTIAAIAGALSDSDKYACTGYTHGTTIEVDCTTYEFNLIPVYLVKDGSALNIHAYTSDATDDGCGHSVEYTWSITD